MAMEALRQFNLDSAQPEDVATFDLREVTIKSALVIPDDIYGVETVLSLHARTSVPASTATISRRWYSFTVSSYSQADSSWTDHASGTIGINMSDQSKS
jgi:hypothetical protein